VLERIEEGRVKVKKLLNTASALVVGLLLTTAVPAFAKQVISPEELFQKAKEQCAKMTNWQQAEEIRACIAKEKGKIIWFLDASARKTCSKYEGERRTRCVDDVYRGSGVSSQSITQDPPAEDPAVVEEGKRYRDKTEPKAIERAKLNDPRSRQSTITGIGSNPSPTLQTNPSGTVKISRPPFLGGTQRQPGGISMRGTTTATPGQLNVEDDVKRLAH
jgi:hypothetical protein